MVIIKGRGNQKPLHTAHHCTRFETYCISGVTYALVSSYGYHGRQIGQRVAQELVVRWASSCGAATRTQRRPAPHAQPVAYVRRSGRWPLLPPRVAPRPHHAVMEDNPVVAHGRSNGPSASPCHGIRTLKFISQGLAVVEGVAASSCRTIQGVSAAGDRKARSTLGLWRRPGRHAARVRTRRVPTRYAPIVSNRLTKSSACSSSTARMVSIKRRVVGSSWPKYWIISR